MGEYRDRPEAGEYGEYGPFYAGYVARVPADDIVSILERQMGETRALLNAVTVRALAWIMAAHELHHRDVLETRYLAEGL